MRKLLVLLVVALVLPVAAYSQLRASNGTLSVREARGVVQLDARGTMTGRLNGRLTITDPRPFDSKRPLVYGAKKTIYRNARTTVYQGKNLRFRLSGARFVIRMDGKAIFLSAIAHGTGRSTVSATLRRTSSTTVFGRSTTSPTTRFPTPRRRSSWPPPRRNSVPALAS